MRTTKCADQPAHPRSLISTSVVRCLGSIFIPLISISVNASLYLASVATQTGLSLNWSQNPKAGFLSCDEAHLSVVPTDTVQIPVYRSLYFKRVNLT